ncbi:unnamed protein product [Durusdinium trenchii]|uniref:PDZ domain-containing protein n=1 Tax=Durusdinium trenchii TaxID=1381693 RepID=A0ABP0RFC1_9DINO
MISSGLIVRALMTGEVSSSDAKNVALSLLAEIAPRKHPPATSVLTQMAKADADPSVRLAALDALKAIAGEGSWQLKEAALHLVLDEDDVVRDAAAEILEHLDLTEEPADLQTGEPDDAPREGEQGDLPGCLTLSIAEDDATAPVSTEPHRGPEEPQAFAEAHVLDVEQTLSELAQHFQSVQCLNESQCLQMDQLLKDEKAMQWLHEKFQQFQLIEGEGIEVTPGPRYPMGAYLDDLRVLEVIEDSVAAKAGVLPGDIIQQVDDVEITTQEELRQQMDVPGRKRFLVERAGEEA